MAKSTHEARVFVIKKEPHPSADLLSIVHHGDYTLCVRTNDWKDGDLAVHVLPESEVPTSNPVFKFLGDKPMERVKAVKMRGIYSYGCPVPAPIGSVVDEDVAEKMGIIHYEPPMENSGTTGLFTEAPDVIANVYDVEDGYKYGHLFQPTEHVIATEKIHGANARYVYSSKDAQIHVGNHERWLLKGNNVWWKCLENNPWMSVWLTAHPDVVVYGEIYGWVQSLRYGHKPGHYSFRAFDLRINGEFLSDSKVNAIWNKSAATWVPLVYEGPWISIEHIEQYANGNSLVPNANHIREGVVVRPTKERWVDEIGRLQLKFKSMEYLSKH